LEGRDAQIFSQRLLSDEPLMLAQLAAKFGVTRERARQLETRLKGRLRAYLEDELGDTIDPWMANSPVSRRERPIVLQGF
jgi:RNA polymerase sigma-32 factor